MSPVMDISRFFNFHLTNYKDLMEKVTGRKGYVIDSNVIEDDPEALEVLSDNSG